MWNVNSNDCNVPAAFMRDRLSVFFIRLNLITNCDLDNWLRLGAENSDVCNAQKNPSRISGWEASGRRRVTKPASPCREETVSKSFQLFRSSFMVR